MSENFRYDLVTRMRAGHEHTREYVSERPLAEGDVIVFRGDRWIVYRVEEQAGADHPRAFAEPARYRLILLHEDGSEEAGAVRRLRSEVPGLGHAFTTLDGRKPVSWEVTDERLVRDERGRPLLELVAERDYGEEAGDLPNHELEHLGARAELPDAAAGMLARASADDLHTELVALDAGAAADGWRPRSIWTRSSSKSSATTSSSSAAWMSHGILATRGLPRPKRGCDEI